MFSWLGSFFGSPWMLGWLPLVAAPILIHLWYRRKYRQVTWAAMEYLLAAIRKSTRRMRIENWLLLLLRTAVILLAVMALAEPLLPAIGARAVSGARIHHVLVLDGSYSMGLKEGDKTLFEAAKQRARQIVEGANEGDAFSLVLMADTARVIVGNAAFDGGAFLRELDATSSVDGGGNLAAATEAVERIIKETRGQYPQLNRQRVYYLTDLGRNSWASENRSPEVEKQFLEKVEFLGRDGSLEVVEVGAAGVENVAVTSLAAADAFAVTWQPVALQAVVRNFSDQRRSDQPVQLWVDDQKVAEQTVDIAPGESSAPIHFNHRFETPGDHVVEVRAPGDPLAVDNSRYLALEVKDHLRALCIGGKPGATHFLALALDTDYRRNSRGVIRPVVAAESALLELDLKQFDCVFLSNVAQFTASEAKALDAYLRSGGGLVFFLGDQVSADRYNEVLAGEQRGSVRVLPATLGQTVQRDKFFFFDPLDYRHPLLHVWRANPQAGLLGTPVSKYFRLNVPEGSRAEVALKFDSGDPAIVEEKIHSGRSILVATDASTTSTIDGESRRPWTLMPTAPSFLVMVQELWRLAISGKLVQRNVEVGQPLGGPLPAAASSDAIVVQMPGGAEERGSYVDQPGESHWTFGDTPFAGVYSVSLPGGAQKFAANVNTRESDLSRLSQDDLPRGIIPFSSQGATAEQTEGPISPPASGIHMAMLWLLLVLLFGESLLAWRLGNRAV